MTNNTTPADSDISIYDKPPLVTPVTVNRQWRPSISMYEKPSLSLSWRLFGPGGPPHFYVWKTFIFHSRDGNLVIAAFQIFMYENLHLSLSWIYLCFGATPHYLYEKPSSVCFPRDGKSVRTPLHSFIYEKTPFVTLVSISWSWWPTTILYMKNFNFSL